MYMIENCKYGDLMTLEEFKSHVACYGFIPYDGDGCYSDGSMMDDDSSVWYGETPEWATHVMWFNR